MNLRTIGSIMVIAAACNASAQEINRNRKSFDLKDNGVKRQETPVVPTDSTVNEIDKDFEEWLRNEPLKSKQNRADLLKPIEPDIRQKLKAPLELDNFPKMTFNPKNPGKDLLPIDKRLEATKEFERKQSGAMMVGVDILAVASYALQMFIKPQKHLSKKEKKKQKLKEILDNY